MSDKSLDIAFSKQQLPQQQFRAAIADVEAVVKAMPNQIEPPTYHHFADKLYGREMHMKAGEVIVGKIHQYDHMCVLTEGYVSVSSEFGNEEFHAPRIWKSKAGVKRMIYAHEDSVWVTFHGTELTNIDDIESDLVTENYEDLRGDV